MFDVGAVKQAFGRHAAEYDDYAYLQKQVRTRCLALANQYFPKHAAILDAGCGTSALAREAKQLSKGWSVTGLDIAFGMCREAKKYHAMAVNADAVSMPFADAQFDGIVSSLMLQWVNDMPAALAEMARVLKPGGHAIIATPVEGTLIELREAFATIDDKAHVSDFLPAHRLLEMAHPFSLVVARQDTIVEFYADTVALMRSLQAIGASNKHRNRPRGLMTPAKFARLERAYPKKADGGLQASWQVLGLVLRKAT